MVGSWLCDRCRARIRRLEEPLCRRCGAEVESARQSCGCRSRLRSLSRLRSAAAYEGPVEMALQRFKYHGWKRLAEPLALLMAERLVVEGLAASWAGAARERAIPTLQRSNCSRPGWAAVRRRDSPARW